MKHRMVQGALKAQPTKKTGSLRQGFVIYFIFPKKRQRKVLSPCVRNSGMKVIHNGKFFFPLFNTMMMRDLNHITGTRKL